MAVLVTGLPHCSDSKMLVSKLLSILPSLKAPLNTFTFLLMYYDSPGPEAPDKRLLLVSCFTRLVTVSLSQRIVIMITSVKE